MMRMACGSHKPVYSAAIRAWASVSCSVQGTLGFFTSPRKYTEGRPDCCVAACCWPLRYAACASAFAFELLTQLEQASRTPRHESTVRKIFTGSSNSLALPAKPRHSGELRRQQNLNTRLLRSVFRASKSPVLFLPPQPGSGKGSRWE